MLADGYDVRTVQELLRHKEVRTTMIYPHVFSRGGRGVRSESGQSGPPARSAILRIYVTRPWRRDKGATNGYDSTYRELLRA